MIGLIFRGVCARVRSIREMSLSIKIFLVSFLSVSCLLLLLGYATQNYLLDQFSRQQTRYVGHLLERTELQIHQFMKYMQGNLLAISKDRKLLSDDRDEMIDFLETYKLFWNQDIKNLYVITPEYDVYGTSNHLWEIRGHPLAKDIFDATGLSHTIYWTEPYVSTVSDHTVTVAVKILGQSDKVTGVLAADLDLEHMLSAYGNWDYTRKEDLLILSRNFYPLTVNSPYVEYNVFDRRYYVKGLSLNDWLESNSPDWFGKDEAGERIYISRQKNNPWGWHIMALNREEILNRSIRQLQLYVLIIGLLGILLSLIVSYYLTTYISRPVKTLVRQMKRVSKGDFQSQVTVTHNGEFGILARSFNTMVQRIKLLMEELIKSEESKKHYELKVLQAQIQPHFLYNTLNSISYLAKRGKAKEVDHMITSLVELLHFHLDKVDERVTLEREIRGVKHYAYLLSVRFPNRFAVEVETEEASLDTRIPKLTLQPLVENSIFHGILPRTGNGTVVISAWREGDNTVIEIADDGIGMSDEKTGALLLTEKESNHQGYFHMGIRNIHERIQLYYGQQYGLTVSSREGEGTTVRIIIPATADHSISDKEARYE